ncbi:hypothetical protein [Streptomyces indicus]|uniref:Lipoprotein n=1 Tax=Streptomyces indicus TaxID=417292 RepID=A0A1G9FWN2_9ACTN|nr:hypothetical protein [Streptomyces indicus]SDK92804.1 hypothetical protein SAMN05421806_114108 [Streptomyces indicus]
MTANHLARARRTAVAGALSMGLFAGTAGLVGCSAEDPDAGTNGMGKLSAEKIHSQSRAAADSVASVTVNADLVVKGQPYKIDMKLNSDGGTGEITDDGVSFRLLRVGDDVYMQADAALLEEGDKPSKASKLSQKYVKVPEDDPKYKQLRTYTDKGKLLDLLLDLPGKLSKGDRSEIGSVRTIQLASNNGEGGTIDVALEGEPYPLRLVRAGDAGTLRLSDWGRSVSIEAPAKDEIVDFGSQLPKSEG